MTLNVGIYEINEHKNDRNIRENDTINSSVGGSRR